MDSASQAAEVRRACPSWIDEGSFSLRPECAPDALHALTGAAERLHAEGDARAVFPDIYAIITRRVVEQAALGAGGIFLEPQWISRLAGRFCERYLETLRWSLERWPQDAEAWTVAYTSCEISGSAPIANVLLGLSAHINFDLAIGIYRTLVELGAAGDPVRLARFKHDHDVVNDLLEQSIPEAFDHLILRHGCPVAAALFEHAYAASRWAAMRVLAAWRGRVWDDAIELLSASSAAARDVVVRRMERRSGRYARLLAFSLPPVEGAPRDRGGRPGGSRRLRGAAVYRRALGAFGVIGALT